MSSDILQPGQTCSKMYRTERRYNEICVQTNLIWKSKCKIYPSITNKCYVTLLRPRCAKGPFFRGFCNPSFVWGGVISATPNGRARGSPLSDLFPSTNPAWLNSPGTGGPARTALRIIETLKLHHHYKVAMPRVEE